jgi:peptidoglycan-associated lipoprotein
MRNIPFLVVALLAAACASQEAKNDTAVTDRSAATTPAPSASPSATSPVQQAAVAGNPLHDPNNILTKRSVYFDFDSNVLKEEYEPLVKAHARFMASHGEARARIEGNCDERGSREYNLALGQRRAESMKKVMTVLGVSDSHIETVSYGEEKPAAGGHDETAWSKNRRDDIRYTVE